MFTNFLISFSIFLIFDQLECHAAEVEKKSSDYKRGVMKRLPYRRLAQPAVFKEKEVSLDCASHNFMTLSRCCLNPPGDLFTTDELIQCNNKVMDDYQFSWVRDYVENRLMDSKNNIDYQNARMAKVIGSAACMVECLLKNHQTIKNGVVDNDDFTQFLVNRSYDAWDQVVDDIVDECKLDVEKILKQRTVPNGGQVCMLEPLAMIQCVRRKIPKNCPDGSSDSAPLCSKGKEMLEKCIPEALRGQRDPATKPMNKMNPSEPISHPGCLVEPLHMVQCVHKHMPMSCLNQTEEKTVVLPECMKRREAFHQCLGGSPVRTASSKSRLMLHVTNETLYNPKPPRKRRTTMKPTNVGQNKDKGTDDGSQANKKPTI